MEGTEDLEPPNTVAAERRALRSFTHASGIHGCLTELFILEGHYLGVRSIRPAAPAREYDFDLRFARCSPVRVYQIPWAWLATALVLGITGLGLLAATFSSGGRLPSTDLIAGAGAMLASFIALYVSFRRTMESLEVRSVHGDASLVSLTGGIGSTRGENEFLAELARNIEAARRARPQTQQEFLCDQMREHHRLRNLGVLSEEQYQASKARILAAH